MNRYLTPLPGVMATAAEHVVNRAVALDDDAARVLRPLEGRWLKFEFEGLALDLWVSAEDGRVRILAEPDEDQTADTTIGGTPGALLAMAIPEFSGPGGVRIEGDARLAQQFQQAMKALDPDVEKGLTDYFGALLGPQMYRLLMDVTGFGRHAARTGGEQAAHWLRDESDLVPSPEEWESFSSGVDRLREAVDRFESRLKRKERK